jgi:hypothetical protein
MKTKIWGRVLDWLPAMFQAAVDNGASVVDPPYPRFMAGLGVLDPAAERFVDLHKLPTVLEKSLHVGRP